MAQRIESPTILANLIIELLEERGAKPKSQIEALDRAREMVLFQYEEPKRKKAKQRIRK